MPIKQLTPSNLLSLGLRGQCITFQRGEQFVGPTSTWTKRRGKLPPLTAQHTAQAWAAEES